MREKKRWFVIYLIMGVVVGLFLLMVASFFALKSFYQEHTLLVEDQETQKNLVRSTVEMSETAHVLIYGLTVEEIRGYDIKKHQLVNRKLSGDVIVRDVYGNVIPITEIKVGDIVKVEIDSNNARIFSISRSANVEALDRVNGIQIDREAQTISTNDSIYKYTDQTIVLKSNGVRATIDQVSAYDIVTLKAYNNIVWSLVIEEAAGGIKIGPLPVDKGCIHIDSSRTITLEEANQIIKVTPGKHELMIELEGYKKMIKDIKILSGEVYEVSLDTLKRLQ